MQNDEILKGNGNMIEGAGNSNTISEYSFNDNNSIFGGETYWYWLESVSSKNPSLSNTNRFYFTTEKIFDLVIVFITSDYERVEDYQLSIYNVRGQLVKRYNGKKDDFWAKTKITWDGRNSAGREVSPGTYFYKLEYGKNAVVRKMVKVGN